MNSLSVHRVTSHSLEMEGQSLTVQSSPLTLVFVVMAAMVMNYTGLLINLATRQQCKMDLKWIPERPGI